MCCQTSWSCHKCQVKWFYFSLQQALKRNPERGRGCGHRAEPAEETQVHTDCGTADCSEELWSPEGQAFCWHCQVCNSQLWYCLTWPGRILRTATLPQCNQDYFLWLICVYWGPKSQALPCKAWYDAKSHLTSWKYQCDRNYFLMKWDCIYFYGVVQTAVTPVLKHWSYCSLALNHCFYLK